VDVGLVETHAYREDRRFPADAKGLDAMTCLGDRNPHGAGS
jgi:hypothetical protein